MAEYNNFYTIQAPSMAPPPQEQEWACPKCTLLNPISAECCDACMHPQLTPSSTNSTAITTRSTAMVPFHSNDPEMDPNYYGYQNSTILSEPLIQSSSGEFENNNNNNNNDNDFEELPLQKKRRRRRRRRVRMVLGGVVGLTVGAIVFVGPAGIIFGTIAGAAGVRQLSKCRERKKDARVARAKAAEANLEALSKPIVE